MNAVSIKKKHRGKKEWRDERSMFNMQKFSTRKGKFLPPPPQKKKNTFKEKYKGSTKINKISLEPPEEKQK